MTLQLLNRRYHEKEIITCALSGIASQRIGERSGYESATIQSLLVKFEERDAMPYKVVLIDEASMINSMLFARLMAKIERDAVVIVVGDDARITSYNVCYTKLLRSKSNAALSRHHWSAISAILSANSSRSRSPSQLKTGNHSALAPFPRHRVQATADNPIQKSGPDPARMRACFRVSSLDDGGSCPILRPSMSDGNRRSDPVITSYSIHYTKLYETTRLVFVFDSVKSCHHH